MVVERWEGDFNHRKSLWGGDSWTGTRMDEALWSWEIAVAWADSKF